MIVLPADPKVLREGPNSRIIKRLELASVSCLVTDWRAAASSKFFLNYCLLDLQIAALRVIIFSVGVSF